nr:hypothetical protein [uncultured Microbacterium sp.]
MDWSVREALLANRPGPSPSEVESLVTADDVVAFVGSARIDLEVQAHVLLNLEALLNSTHAAASANAIAGFLYENAISADLAAIHALAEAGAARPALLRLLASPDVRSHFAASPTRTLEVLGGVYAAIVDMEAESPKFSPIPEHKDFLETLQALGLLRVLQPGVGGLLRIRRGS